MHKQQPTGRIVGSDAVVASLTACLALDRRRWTRGVADDRGRSHDDGESCRGGCRRQLDTLSMEHSAGEGSEVSRALDKDLALVVDPIEIEKTTTMSISNPLRRRRRRELREVPKRVIGLARHVDVRNKRELRVAEGVGPVGEDVVKSPVLEKVDKRSAGHASIPNLHMPWNDEAAVDKLFPPCFH